MLGGRAVCISLIMVAAGFWGGAALAQDGASRTDMSDVFRRIEQRDREARNDGLVLDNIPVQQRHNDPIRKSMKLSIGEVGGRTVKPFDDPESHYLTDPIAPPDAPPFGLNLKLKF